MAILAGDIKLVESAVMEDVPEGGGAPTDNVIVDGESNNIFPDISELDRAGGRVNLRKVHIHVQTPNRDTFMGANFIVAEPPDDPNVSITVFSTGETFDTREDAANFIEAYLVKGPVLPGYLLENHVAGQRSIQLFQRPGSPLPPVGRTLVLVANEDTPSEIVQYVRTTRVESVIGTYTELVGGSLVDFQAEVVTCDISDALRENFPGSPPSRLFAVASGKTRVRDTTVADAGSYHGVVALASSGTIGDATVQVESVYTQLVPNARTEVSALDQRPAAQRELTLAETPRLVTVGAAPHSKRIKIGQENRGFNFVDILRPFPAPNSVVVSFRALGSWYTMQDDGAGNLTGTGVGTVNYDNGSIAVTFPSLPDVGSSIIYSWGEKSAYTNRSAAIGFRMPEVSWTVPHAPLDPGSVVVTWESGGVLKTATDNGTGGFTGDATGSITYNSGFISLKPLAMIDAGGEFNTEYAYTSALTESFAGLSPDAGGFATITLGTPPLAGTVTARWITVRNVSNSSGTSDLTSESSTEIEYNGAVIVDPPTPPTTPPVVGSDPPVKYKRLECTPQKIQVGQSFNLTLYVDGEPDGTYTWVANIHPSHPAINLAAMSGSFTVTNGVGSFSVASIPDTLGSIYCFQAFNPSSQRMADSPYVETKVPANWPAPTPSVPQAIKPPADFVRDPVSGSGAQTGATATSGLYPGGVHFITGATLYVNALPTNSANYGPVYDPPASGGTVWNADDLAAGQRTLMSRDGVLRTYFLAGA
jgi:hypothetical protein